MEKGWKFLIENRFWNRDREFFEKFRNFRKNQDFRKISKNPIFFNSNQVMEIFGFFDFSKILIFSISISKSIFDQKFSIFFHDLFFKPLKNQLENPHVKARSPENAMRTREKSKRADRLLCKKNVHFLLWKDTLKKKQTYILFGICICICVCQYQKFSESACDRFFQRFFVMFFFKLVK